MSLKPGSFLWLIAHDMRLNWRGLTGMFTGAGAGGGRKAALILAAGAVLLHLMAWPLVRLVSPYIHDGVSSSLPLVAAVGGVFTWMIAQSLFSATRTLYDRTDLDLLLGSPLPAARIVAAKTLAIAASTLGSIAIFIVPLADMGALTGGPVWLGIYPVLIGLALIATAVGLGLAMALFELAGPRRARIYAHMTGAMLGGVFVLGAQVYAVLPAPTRAYVSDWFLSTGMVQPSWTSSLFALPLNAVRGDLSSMAALLALSGAVFFLVVAGLGRRFAAAAVSAAGAPVAAEAARANDERITFGSGVGRNLRRKEWKLLMRDHSLFAQLSLQIIYTIPIAVVLLRSQLLPTAYALVPAIVVIAAQLAGSIAWITVSGEDAPELIASAPVTAQAADRAKLSAVAVPVLAILALPLLGLALASWQLALTALLFSAMGGASTALLNFWHPMPGNRRGMLRRHSQSKLIGLVEHGLAMLWALAVVFVLAGSTLALVPMAMVAGILAYSAGAHRRQQGTAGRVRQPWFGALPVGAI